MSKMSKLNKHLLADAQNKSFAVGAAIAGSDGKRRKNSQRLFDAGFATRLQLEDSEFRVNQLESQLQMARVTHQAIRDSV
jgi:hypothetical protein